MALKGSDAAGATTLAELADAKLGVQVGTTSLDAVTELIKPTSQPQVFNDSNDTVRALKAKRVDAIVVDLPTAFYLTAAEVPEAKITGQFDAPGGDDWGLVLAKDSELTDCVDPAIEALKSSGELDSRSPRSGWAARPARPSCNSRSASPRPPRTPPRPRGGAPPPFAPADGCRRPSRRWSCSACSSRVVVTSEGWPTVRETFFDPSDFAASFPAVLDGFWLDVKLFLIVEVAVLVLGLVVALARISRTPALFPLRLLSALFVDVFRGIPTILVVYLIGFGVPALMLSGLPTDPVVLGGIALTLAYSRLRRRGLPRRDRVRAPEPAGGRAGGRA